MISLLIRMSAALNRLCMAASVGFLIVMLVLVAIQVIARYGFSAPPQWTEEAARYAMVWAGLLGATVSFHEKFDPVLIRVRPGYMGVPPLAWRLVRLLAVLLFACPVLYFSPDILLLHIHRHTESLQFNSAIVIFVVPLMAGIILFHAVAELLARGNEAETATSDQQESQS